MQRPSDRFSLQAMPFRQVLAYALGGMAPMAAMWFVAPALQAYLVRRGVDIGDAWTFKWWIGIIPYPVPFNGRAALGVVIMFLPSVTFVFIWWLAQRRQPRDH